jgi:formylglycine-generating enzyme required for sulfatase activity
MASIITLVGIDDAILSLNYSNKNTFKYKYVHHIRQYYTNENSVESVDEIDNEELIKILWDTGGSSEEIKKKRKNLNSLRSSVNADLKKLYMSGKNPEGIKIGPGNIFAMLDDAKDKILNEYGYDLKPDGTLKLDQIMDILRLANESVYGLMAVKEKDVKDGLGKIDQLKSLIKGLSEKVGLSSSELSETDHKTEWAPDDSKKFEKVDDLGEVSDEIAGEGEVEGIFEELEEVNELEEDEFLEEIENVEEDEILEEVEDLEEVSDEIAEQDEIEENPEEIEDLVEDEVLEEIEDVDPDELTEVTGDSEAVGGQDDLEGAGIDRGFGEGDENFNVDNRKDGIKKAEGAKETQAIGLPVDSLGKEYSDEVSDKVKKDRLLAEEFDGYLGVMDRYYNHYILIPGGQYIVGTKKPKKDEKFERLISLSPFYIGRFPVTNCLFEIFVEKTGYKTVAEKVGYGNVYYGRCQRKKDEKTGFITSIWNSSLYCKIVEGACWYQPFGPGSTLHNKRNHPVVQISLEDAMAFAAWTGKRLPTEDEWEAAARTEKGWSFPWGKEWKKHCCNIEDSFTGDTTPVEKYAKFENELGVVDTMGNILEWTSDNFTALSNNKNRSGCHIAKGGSWISKNDITLFSRFKIAPESHSNILGFRCVAH